MDGGSAGSAERIPPGGLITHTNKLTNIEILFVRSVHMAKSATQTRPLRTPSRLHPPSPRVVAVVARQPSGVPLKPFMEDLISEPLRSWTVNSGAAQLVFDVQDVRVGVVEEEHVFERHLRTLRYFS